MGADIKFSGKTCPLPGSLPHGNWSCEMQEIPIHGTSFLDDEDAQSYPGRALTSFYSVRIQVSPVYNDLWIKFPALQCRLECEPGFVSQRSPLITCVNGEYAKECHYLQTSTFINTLRCSKNGSSQISNPIPTLPYLPHITFRVFKIIHLWYKDRHKEKHKDRHKVGS